MIMLALKIAAVLKLVASMLIFQLNVFLLINVTKPIATKKKDV
jgi:hypothetical protein